MPLLNPPPRQDRQDKPVNPNPVPERRARGVDDKLSTLRDYRRTRGLCFRCGEKWSRDHRCPEAIQLHALQELWDVCFAKDCQEACMDDCQETGNEDAQLCLAISMAASGGPLPVTSIQFMGQIQGHLARILIDSGSSDTFVSTSLADKLDGISTFTPPLKVTVADGTQLLCSSQFQQLTWSVQECDFVSMAKVLPLSSYELTVGMDWLAAYSPMQIDWQHKWLLISQGPDQHLLQGSLSALPAGSVVQVSAILPDDTVVCQDPLPSEVSSLLIEFQSVFAPPTGYPPARDCDHTIPLLLEI